MLLEARSPLGSKWFASIPVTPILCDADQISQRFARNYFRIINMGRNNGWCRFAPNSLDFQEGNEMSLGKIIIDFFANLTKEPAEEAGGMIADRIRFLRIKQALKLKDEVEGMLRQRGVTDKRDVPLKLTVAILEGATIEDEDDLHNEWAKLLANAIDPSFKPEIRIAYTEILRSLNPFDVRLLHEIYDLATAEPDKQATEVDVNLVDIANRISASKLDTELSRDCLIRQRCIVQSPKVYQPGQYISHESGSSKWITPPPQQIGTSDHIVKLTPLGATFTKCCQ